MASTDPLIECRGVHAGYGEGAVLEGIDFAVREREIVTLLGGSGCGKSTLLKVLIGLLPPLEGQVLLFGEDLYALPERDRGRLLRRIGVVFQQGALFGSLTAGDNVAWPLREHTRLDEPLVEEVARMKLDAVGLRGFEDRKPSDLSGGQRKRVGLARAIALDPALVFCDEPSAGLDPITGAALDETLLALRDLFGLTIVAVTHELESIRLLSDRAVMLGGGRILAAGTVAELTESSIDEVRRFFAREPAAAKQDATPVLELWEKAP